MTELSFNEQSHQVHHDTEDCEIVDACRIDDDDESMEYDNQHGTKHVTIDEELPVVYKPKSFSVPDLLDENYVLSKHQHPALKFSTSNAGTTDAKFFKKWFPKENQATCHSPFTQRKNKVKHTNSEITRQRGKTFPQYPNDEVDKPCDHQKVNETKNRSRSTNSTSYDTNKLISFWRKINLFPKLGGKNKRHRKTKSQGSGGSFHDLPPIRCSNSMADILAVNNETNNNSPMTTDESEHYFHTTKSYKPAQQHLKDERCKCEQVQLKRIKSLPIL